MKLEDVEKLKEKFMEIKNKGWVKSTRKNNTGIGKTFEDLLEKEEDNLYLPDFGSIEIKTKRLTSTSFTTLFTKSPDGEKNENTRLRDTFGVLDGKFKKLHTSVFANRMTEFFNLFKFKIDVDREKSKVFFCVYDMNEKLIEKTTYWSFDTISECLNRKLKTLAVIKGDNKFVNSEEYFRFENMEIYNYDDFNKFLKAIENGYIMVDIRIGSYKSGKNIGKVHDHGTGFRIKESELEQIFSKYEV